MSINITRLREPGWPPSQREITEIQKKFHRLFPDAKDPQGHPLKIDGKVGIQMVAVMRFLLDQVEIDQGWFDRFHDYWEEHRRKRRPFQEDPPVRPQASDHADDT